MELPTIAHITRSKRQFLLVLITCLIGVGGALVAWVVLYQAGEGSLRSAQHITSTVDTAKWKTYTDNQHGFALRYPAAWDQLPTPSANTRGEPAGIKISVPAAHTCDTAAYARSKSPPYRSGVTLKRLPVSGLSGFMLEALHSDNVAPRKEAVILNCPYAIHIGMNPTGIPHAEQLFRQVLSSVRVWKPAQEPTIR
jgi:hypothetical protein